VTNFRAMTRRLVCLHGHFYQPPRENPWIEEVEVQDAASPFHDWNARISAECYGPNGAARLKTPEGRISDIVNNYRHLSFNFGPTLLSWMEVHDKEVYRLLLEADAHSLRVRGHGNALAQGYGHAILPLCSPRDRRTQIKWGVADFRERFQRDPEGMWLPETAADLATLRDLAAEGIRFTVLSPYQAMRVRSPQGEWADAQGARFDPTRPYRVSLGDGKEIAVFFYDGPIARAIAFGEGLQNGDDLVGRVLGGFDPGRGHDELLTVAVDGETFGHHKKGGDEVLAAALRKLSARGDVELVNLGQALERMPPTWEAEIAEGSSWSCAHGLERWKSDCGCQANGQPGWKQTWRAPLRAALDLLRDELAHIFEREGAKLLRDPWEARDAFIELVLDPRRAGAEDFLKGHVARPLSEDERVTALKLLEMQRQAMLMYTSCGWFFSEISGLETVQILKYAARALQLAGEVTGRDLLPAFQARLEEAPSNLPEFANGARIFDLCVKPSVATMESVGAHFAISTVFNDYVRTERMFCYEVQVKERKREQAGAATLSVSRLELRSLVTRERLDLSACVLHFGGSDFRCGIGRYGKESHAACFGKLFGAIGKLSLVQLVREIDFAFPGRDYTLRDLFLDERRRVAHVLLDETTERYENDYLQIFESNRRLMEFLREINSPVPRPLQVAADVAISHQASRVAQAMARGEADAATARSELLSAAETAQKLGARLDPSALHPFFEETLHACMARVSQGQADAFGEACDLLELASRLSVWLDLWSAQNKIWSLAASGAFRAHLRELPRLARKFWFDENTLLARASRPAGVADPAAAPAAGPAAAAASGPIAAAAAPAL
jgi:alpha-amylase/alpha-mannosidase (GH57 family)